MKTIDPGHKYILTPYDNGLPQELTFMKREGDSYPGNKGHYPGTNCQEVLRVLINRIDYLQNQIPDSNNLACLRRLKECLWLFEDRAARRHNIDQFDFTPEDIHEAESCLICGHVVCHGH